jgi:anaerobic ribonucleoside-triphosphate reductase
MTTLEELTEKLSKYKRIRDAMVEADEKEAFDKKIAGVDAEIKALNTETEQDVKKQKRTISHDKLRSQCQTLISELKTLLHRYEGTQKDKKANQPVVKRRVSTLIAQGIAGTVKRAVSKELSREKVMKINLDALDQAKKNFNLALRSLRDALGGISSENDAFIKAFNTEMDEMISEVKEKQKAHKEKASERVEA